MRCFNGNLREIGVETGGSNVQFAINPENGDMVVIEMNQEFQDLLPWLQSNWISYR